MTSSFRPLAVAGRLTLTGLAAALPALPATADAPLPAYGRYSVRVLGDGVGLMKPLAARIGEYCRLAVDVVS